MIDTAELRRRWTDKTNAVFSPRDRHQYIDYPAEEFEREFDFEDCEAVSFWQGHTTPEPVSEDFIMSIKGSGHMTLPPGVRVTVTSGYVKWDTRGSLSSGSGLRAPPTSRVGVTPAPSQAAYARSSADSGYAGSLLAGGNEAAAFMMNGSKGLSVNNSRPSSAESSSGDWEVVEEMPGAGARRVRDDACSIAPSESISSVGTRQLNRRATGY